MLLDAILAFPLAVLGTPSPWGYGSDTQLQIGGSDLSKPSFDQDSITSYCVVSPLAAATTSGDFQTTFSDFCRDLAINDECLSAGQVYSTKDTYCNDERCIVMSIGYSCDQANESPAISSLTYDECMSNFILPLTADSQPCASGGYLGGSISRSCWSALSVVTPPDSSELAELLEFPRDVANPFSAEKPKFLAQNKKESSNKVDVRDLEPLNLSTRGRPAGYIVCWNDSVVQTSYTDFKSTINDFCGWYATGPGQIPANSSYTSGTRYCTTERCINFRIAYEDGCSPNPLPINETTCERFFMPVLGLQCGPTDGTFGGGVYVARKDCLFFASYVNTGLSAGD